MLNTHFELKQKRLNSSFDVKNLRKKFLHLHMHIAASILTESSGGSHSGKNGFVTYLAKVSATMATVHGRTIKHSAQRRMNATNGPKVL